MAFTIPFSIPKKRTLFSAFDYLLLENMNRQKENTAIQLKYSMIALQISS